MVWQQQQSDASLYGVLAANHNKEMLARNLSNSHCARAWCKKATNDVISADTPRVVFRRLVKLLFNEFLVACISNTGKENWVFFWLRLLSSTAQPILPTELHSVRGAASNYGANAKQRVMTSANSPMTCTENAECMKMMNDD